MRTRPLIRAAALLGGACALTLTACDTGSSATTPQTATVVVQKTTTAGQSTVVQVGPQSGGGQGGGSDHGGGDHDNGGGGDNATPGGCSTDDTAATAEGISKIARPLPDVPNVTWVPDGVSDYNTCNALSFVALNTQGATAGSPYQLLLFHRGKFVGTGVKCNLPFQTIVDSSQSTVQVNYKYLKDGDAFAAPHGSVDVVFSWVNGRVVMNGSLPREATHGQC